MGKSIRPLVAILPALQWSDNQRLLKVRSALVHTSEWAFDAASLDDSVYVLAPSEDGLLEQWLRFDYPDLGIELDTLPVVVSRVPVSRFGLGISLGSLGNMGGRGRRGRPWSWWGGVDVWMTRSLRTEAQVSRVNLSAPPTTAQVLGASRVDWDPVHWMDWTVHAGASVKGPGEHWHWMVQGDFAGGGSPRWSLIAGLQYRWGGGQR